LAEKPYYRPRISGLNLNNPHDRSLLILRQLQGISSCQASAYGQAFAIAQALLSFWENGPPQLTL
jgi:hypothetical protein